MAEVKYTRVSLNDEPDLYEVLDSSNEMEVARCRRAISRFLSERSQELLAWATELSIAPLNSIISLAKFLGPAVGFESDDVSYNIIVENSLEDTRRFYSQNSPHPIDELFASQFIRQLHLVFNFKAGALQRNSHRYRTKVWDCTEMPLSEWMREAKLKSILITRIETQWTSISKYDSGLLVARHVLDVDLISRVYAKKAVSDLMQEKRVGLPGGFNKKRLTTPSISLRNQMKVLDLIDPSIHEIGLRFYSFFTNLIENEEGGCFVEVELAKALTAWYAANKMHGVSMANARFCASISRSLVFAFQLKVKVGDRIWKWSDGSLTDWFEQLPVVDEVSVTIAGAPKGVPSKQKLILSHLAFKRKDLVVWRVPMPGQEVGHFWGDFAYD